MRKKVLRILPVWPIVAAVRPRWSKSSSSWTSASKSLSPSSANTFAPFDKPGLAFKSPFRPQCYPLRPAHPGQRRPAGRVPHARTRNGWWPIPSPAGASPTRSNSSRPCAMRSGARARLNDLVFSELRREVASHTFATVIGVQTRGHHGHRGEERACEGARIRHRSGGRAHQACGFASRKCKPACLPACRPSANARPNVTAARARRKPTNCAPRPTKSAPSSWRRRSKAPRNCAAKATPTATRIYAEAYGKDPEFYRFVRSLQSYELFLGKRSTLLLSADSPLFRHLGQRESRVAGLHHREQLDATRIEN